MKQVQFTAFGVPHEVAACVEVPEVGPPGPDEVVIEVEAFPINPADLLTITGAYAVRPQLPATLGAECAGRIVAVGSGVRDLTVGDRVINLGRDNWCQQRKVPAAQALKVPADADVLQLAMLKVNPATALMMLRQYVALQPGDWVIQDAANSGVGTNLIRLAKTDGIRTVNVVRREALIEPLTAIGADAVVVDGDDLAARVQQATVGAPIRLAIDAIGGAMVLRLADCLAEGGTVVNYGLLSGRALPARGSPHDLQEHHADRLLAAEGPDLDAAPGSRGAVRRSRRARGASGALRVEVEATYPIEEIKAALAHAGREGRRGKILVTPNGPV